MDKIIKTYFDRFALLVPVQRAGRKSFSKVGTYLRGFIILQLKNKYLDQLVKIQKTFKSGGFLTYGRNFLTRTGNRLLIKRGKTSVKHQSTFDHRTAY